MKKFDKAIILLIGVGILFNLLKDKFYKKQSNEIVIAGHHVDKQPCVSGMNELFSTGVDSTKMCDCLLPKFYQLIKDDPKKIKKFEEVGFFTLQGNAKDSATQLFRDCVVEHIIDTSYKLDMKKFKEPFLLKLKDTLSNMSGLNNVNIDSLCNCVMHRLDGNITIKEYFAEDYLTVEKIKNVLTDCFGQVIKKK
ncbi:MAG: hypothetical protein EOP48_05970 [Sphingobacteriales bacterium]|nr:MAG: hypothetical protein EOP48_05970 [Sphingobacteriales bacterium]